MKIEKVHLAGRPLQSLWDVHVDDKNIASIEEAGESKNGEAHHLLLPSLCHPHVHLDKAFLLSSENDRYQDLVPTSGTFQEALQITGEAKSRYSREDLELRGTQLIAESVEAGVTVMRAFVEVDYAVGMKCLDVGIALKAKFAKVCQVQIVAFAQDPIFSGPHGEQNRKLMQNAVREDQVDVVGTTPYVESDYETTIKNIEWAVDVAVKRKLHLDFHLDYNLDESNAATVWDVIRILKEYRWPEKTNKTIVLGHCTRLTLFSAEEMVRLAANIRDSLLPISFVGLPTSDMYMMGRAAKNTSGERFRGTLQIPSMVKEFGINCAIGINNVGNAFTPWGSCDPLSLACLGVGLYHAGTAEDAELLYEAVSIRAKKAIGVETADSLELIEGQPADLVLYKNKQFLEHLTESAGVSIRARQNQTVRDVVWGLPQTNSRHVVRFTENRKLELNRLHDIR